MTDMYMLIHLVDVQQYDVWYLSVHTTCHVCDRPRHVTGYRLQTLFGT